LRKLIVDSLPVVFVLNIRYDKKLHKPAYECRFARSHRTDDPEIYVAPRARRYVAVYIYPRFSHEFSPPYSAFWFRYNVYADKQSLLQYIMFNSFAQAKHHGEAI
jgi:hypothetical protein